MRSLIVLLLALLPVASSAQTRSADLSPSHQCYSATLADAARPAYARSAAWLTPNELVVVDAVNNELLTYDTRGRLRGRNSDDVDTSVKKAFGEFLPVSVETSSDGTWLELIGARMARLDASGMVTETKDLWGTQIDGSRLGGFWSWTLAGNDLFGLGEFQLPDESVTSAFFRVGLDDPSRSEIVQLVSPDSVTRLWNRTGLQLTASLGSTAYALTIEDGRLSIIKSQPGLAIATKVGTLTGPLRTTVSLGEFKRPEDLVNIMGKVSTQTAPYALLGWNDRLYLLWRYAPNGAARWALSRIDPAAPKVEQTIFLNSSADHLIVVPGPRSWAVVEKGALMGYGIQTTKSITFIPVSEVDRAFADGRTLCR